MMIKNEYQNNPYNSDSTKKCQAILNMKSNPHIMCIVVFIIDLILFVTLERPLWLKAGVYQ